MEKINNKLVTLKKNKEFTFVYHRGKSCATRRMVLIYFKNRYGGIRSGFSVSKKVGKAVKGGRDVEQRKNQKGGG